MKPKSTLRSFLLLAGSSLLAISSVQAQSGNWNVDAPGDWSLDTNWNPVAVPGNAAGNIIGLTNDITAARTVTIDTTSRTAGTLNIGDTDNSHAFTLAASSGGFLTFDNSGGATLSETGSVTDVISSPVTLNSNLTANVAGSLTASVVISETGGARAITKTGAGRLSLSGANTFTGQVTVQEGALSVGTANNISTDGPLGNNALPVILGNTGGITGTLRYSGATATSSKPFTMAAGGSGAFDVVTAANTLTLSGLIDGSGSLTKSGAGGLTLTGSSNSYSGGTIITGGTLTANSNANLGNSAGGITFSGNGTLAMSGTINHAREITLNPGFTGTILSGAGITYTNTGKVTGAGNLLFTQTGSGIRNLTFSNQNNDFTGSVRIDNTSGQQLAVAFNSLADVVGAGNIIMSMTIANGPNTFRYGSGATAPLILNNRRLELTGTASTIINAIFSNQNSTHPIRINTDLLISTTGNKGLSLDAVPGPNNVFAGVIANGNVSSATQVVRINKTDGGTWALTNTANTYTGATTLAAGTLIVTKLADGGSPSSIGQSSNSAGNLVFSSGAVLVYTGTGDSSDRAVTFDSNANNVGFTINSSGSGPLDLTSTAAITNSSTGSSQARFYTITGTNTGDNTLAAAITNNATNAANLTKGGPGKWVITNQNTFTGGLFIQSGILEIKSGAASLTQSLGNITTNVAEATLVSNKSGVGALSTTFAGRGRNAGGSVNFVSTGGTNGTDNSLIIAGGLQGFIDAGTFFNGADYAARSATGGFLRALAYGTDPDAEAVDTITAAKHIKLTSTPASQAAVSLLSLNLAGSGVSWTSTGDLTVPGILKSGGGSPGSISGANLTTTANAELVIRTDTAADALGISSNLTHGSGALTKSGSGILTLSGTNTYTGVTHVNAGTLSIGANVNLGAEATGAQLNLKGGTLQATGTFGLFNGTAGTNNRNVTLLAQSNIEVTGSNTLTIAGVISNNSSAASVAPGFNKTGTGTLVLSGANTYTGPTGVNAGTLTLGESNRLANSSNVSIGAATFNASTFTDTVGTLDVTAAATINLGAGGALVFADSRAVDWTGGSLNITGTYVSGSSLRFGTTSAGLTPAQLGLITVNGSSGTFSLDANGFLTGTAGGGSAYSTWAAVNAPSGTPGNDFDGDGVPNAVEFVLGGLATTNDLGKLPTLGTSGGNMTFVFQRDQDSIDPGKTTTTIEVSTDLVTWTTPPSPYSVPDGAAVNNPGVTVLKNNPSPGIDTVTLTVVQSPDTKKFARLKVVVTP